MMKAGIPLVQSFDIVIQGLDHPRMSLLTTAIRAEIAAGNSFAESLRRYPRVFDALYCNLIEVGESSGALDIMLDRLADRALLRLPIFGNIVRTSCYARFSRTLSTTYAAGVPLVDALASVAGATGNSVYEEATKQIRSDVASGQPLHSAISDTALFPNMISQMASIGEESGSLDAMLERSASHFEAEVDDAVDSLTSLLEPAIIVVIGILVGGLVIAMYLPIFQLGSVI